MTGWRHSFPRLTAAMRRKWFTLLLPLLVLPRQPSAGFEGFGSNPHGGEPGRVAEVTSLADSGPGSLREALEKGNNLRVKFRTGGTILLQRPLGIRGKSFITVDGSTAPDPGVTLEGDGVYISDSHDIVVSHLRVRNSQSDGITVKQSHHIVIDHCSLTNAADENIGITRDVRNVTVSWCIIGDTRPDAHARRAKGVLVAEINHQTATKVSFHHNLFVNEAQRSPQISTAGLFDIRNNVIWNWGTYGIRIRNGAWGNIVNNVFRTHRSPDEAVVLTPDAGPVYIAGNSGPAGVNVNALSTARSAFSVAKVDTHPTTLVEREVLRKAGACPRDHIDRRLVQARSELPALGIFSDGFDPSGKIKQAGRGL